MASSNDPYSMYIYNLPYAERKLLCQVLDLNDSWETLGGHYMKYSFSDLGQMSKAVMRNQSPTDELLKDWQTRNHTVLELFVLLSKIQHYQAMRILKPFVNPKYHKLIYEGEGNFSQALSSSKESPPTKSNIGTGAPSLSNQAQGGKDLAFGNHNLNTDKSGHLGARKKLPSKSLNANQGEVKILNTPKASDADVQGNLATMKIFVIDTNKLGDQSSPMILYSELEIATEGWNRRNLLGRGGFGAVYKGVWKNTQVAVKRLEIQKAGDVEGSWKTQREQSLRELKYLNSYRHDNILPLYGFSIGGEYDCLVYQYMHNGSLEDRILCRGGSKPLTWAQRHNIATGTARGLQFLHTIGDKPLVHGDVKSANILLGPHLEPKIGDFGLAREGPLQHYTHVKVSRVHGTRPYLPDEFLRLKKFSTKVDTFSFGIVLFELATGLRAYDENRSLKYLRDHVLAFQDRIGDICDKKAGFDDSGLYLSLITLGRLCVEKLAKERPEMVLVLQKLDSMAATRESHTQQAPRNNSLTPANAEALGIHDQASQPRKISDHLTPPGRTNPTPSIRTNPTPSPSPDGSRVVRTPSPNPSPSRPPPLPPVVSENPPLSPSPIPLVPLLQDAETISNETDISHLPSTNASSMVPAVVVNPPTQVSADKPQVVSDGVIPLLSLLGVKDVN